ncbi:MAG: RlmE family RNA methyltransferase [Petrotogales bacterium]
MTRWYREKKKGHYYKEAKRLGYRARSAFKLKQIQNRFCVFSKDDIVVDLGASPGGWSQVAREYVGSQGMVFSVDILFMKPLDNVQFLQGDITDDKTIETIIQMLQGKKADVVLSDMSPDISGNYSVDQARSLWLCKRALKVASKVLRPGGTFVCKVFEGTDTREFIEKTKRCFLSVKRYSPAASRKRSSEIYIIAKSLKNIPI